MLVEAAPDPGRVLVVVRVRFWIVVSGLAHIRFRRSPDESVPWILGREILFCIFVTRSNKVGHASQSGQTSAQSLDVVRVVIGARGVLQEHARVQWSFHLLLRIIDKVAVGKNVAIEIVLKIWLDLIGQVPQLMCPHKLVMRHGKQRMAALRNLGIGALANLVSRLKAAIACACQGDSTAGRVQQPLVRNLHLHPVLEEVMPLVPHAQRDG